MVVRNVWGSDYEQLFNLVDNVLDSGSEDNENEDFQELEESDSNEYEGGVSIDMESESEFENKANCRAGPLQPKGVRRENNEWQWGNEDNNRMIRSFTENTRVCALLFKNYVVTLNQCSQCFLTSWMPVLYYFKRNK